MHRSISKFRMAEGKLCNFRRLDVGALLMSAFENNCNRWWLTMNGSGECFDTGFFSLYLL